MVMKVFNKGQVVIPAAIRRELHVAIGDLLDVELDHATMSIHIKPRKGSQAKILGGSLSTYAGRIKPPSKSEAARILAKGLLK